MAATPDTRKPIDELTREDLHAFAIWEFAMDEEDVPGHDETWVRPVLRATVPADACSVSVAADFVGGTGMEFEGFVVLSADMGSSAPDGAVLLYGGRYIPITHGSDGARRRFAQSIGLREGDVFPLKYIARAKVEGENDLRRGELR